MTPATNVDKGTITLPLTPRQSLIWIENTVCPDAPVNHVTTLFAIKGNVQPEPFEQAFHSLVAHHEALQATVAETMDGPHYIVPNDHISEIDTIDLSRARDPHQAYQDWLRERCSRLLKFGSRLYDAALVKIHDDEWIFFLNLHHIISDGSSTLFLHRELEAIYVGLISGNGAEPAESRRLEHRAFSHFIEETERHMASEDAAKDKFFWSKKFASAVPPISYYGSSSTNKEYLTTRVTRHLGPDISRRIRAMGPLRPPLFVFTTVLFAYLRRISLNSDLCIGVPFHNRTAELTNTAGLVMEIVPYRVGVDADDSLNSLLKKVKNETRSVRPHSRHTISARTAGFDVLLNYRPDSMASFAGHSATYDSTTPLNLLESLPESSGRGGHPPGHESLAVGIHHAEGNGEFCLTFDFDRSVWPDPAEKDRAADHFMRLLAAMIDDSERKIDEIDILTPSEKLLLLPKDDSARCRGQTLPTVDEQVAVQIGRRPDHPAIMFGDEQFTYRELGERVERLSTHLRKRGVQKDSLVGVCLNRSPDLVVTLLAVWRAGAAYVPIDPKQPDRRIEYILEDSEPVVLVSDQGLRHKLGSATQDRVICLDDTIWSASFAEASIGPAPRGDLAYVIFTSGSTGRPKGVQVSHHGLSAFLRAMAREPGMDEDDRLLAVTTISFDIAALELFLPLTVGATVHIAPSEAAVNAERLATLLDGTKITVFQATPATFRMLAANGWKGSREIKLLCGGEALSADLAEFLLSRAASVWNMYGPTETTIWSVIKKVENAIGPIPIGRPIPGTQAYVLNNSLQPVPIGVPGELYLAGDGVARGYLGREDLIRERFLSDPLPVGSSAPLYRTGDLVRWRPDGDLEFLGRRDFQVKIRGFRVELQEIEALIGEHDAVSQSIVTTFTNVSGEQGLVAYIIPKDGITAISRDMLVDHLRSRLPTYMIPSSFVTLHEFPLTPNGKVDRAALLAPEAGHNSVQSTDYVAPTNDLEIALAEAWRHVLNIDRVGLTDNFFEIGGDSLLALELVAEMERSTGIDFDLGIIFQFPMIAQLIGALKSSANINTTSIAVPLQSKGDGRPLFCICGINLYRPLANRLSHSRPVLGLYAAEERELLQQTLDDGAASVSIERLADAYCDAIQRYQTSGPYCLAGLSFGGILAVEVASRLQSRGELVDVVILIDTLLRHAIHRNWLRWFRYHVTGDGLGTSMTKAANIFRQALRRMTSFDRFTEQATNGGQSAADVRALMRRNYLTAMEKYEGKPYEGSVVLFRATDNQWMATHNVDPDYGWTRYLRNEIKIHDAPGDHLKIIQEPHVAALADVVESYLPH